MTIDPHTSSATSSPLRILVVDDDAINRKVILLMLQSIGHAAETATNGMEALEMASGGAYDIVLMDVQMPKMDGIEASRRIREALEGSTQPYIVALTAGGAERYRDECLGAGMNDFVGKPVTAAMLIQVIERAASPKQPTEELLVRGIDPEVHARFKSDMGEGSESLVEEIIDDFVRIAADGVAKMQDAAAKNDWEEVGRRAHSLRVSSAWLGARYFSRLCDDVESNVRNDSTATVGRLLETMAREYVIVREMLGR